MNLQHVKTFCAIAAEGSFSHAADVLHLTQPTISAQIQALETQVGARVFERSAKGISLTQAGSVFHEYALQILELVERTEQAMDELRGLARGRLDVGASTIPGHYLLPRALAEFKQKIPTVEISLTVGNSHDIRMGVRDGGFELGVVGEQAREPRLAYEALTSDRLVAVVATTHPLASRAEITVAELVRQPMVMREHGSGTRGSFNRALQQAGFDPHALEILLELGSNEAVKSAVRAVPAVAVLSEWCVRDEVSQGLLKALPVRDLDLGRRFWLVRRANGYLSVASESFVTFLRERVAE